LLEQITQNVGAVGARLDLDTMRRIDELLGF
jgi:hypothetical protein